MNDLPTRLEVSLSDGSDWQITRAYEVGDLLTREEAANAIIAFYNKYAGDVGQRWPTVEDALAWLVTDDE